MDIKDIKDTTEIKEAKLKRRTAKAALTRAGKSLMFLINAGRPIEEVKEALTKLDETFKRLEEKQDSENVQLENILEDDEFEKEESVMEECQERYLHLSMQAKDYIKALGKKIEGGDDREDGRISNDSSSPSDEETTSRRGQVSDSVTQSFSRTKFKVSKPKLPTFSGDVRMYYEFRSDFKYLVEGDFNSRDAVTLLRSALEGKASEMVCGMGQDYLAIWDTLDAAFGDPRRITDAVTNDIVKFRPLQDGEDGRFCDFVQLVHRCFNLLKEVGKRQDMDNNYVIALLEQKLCSQDKRMWARYIEREKVEVTMSNLLDWLTVEMKTRMRTNSDIRCPTRVMKNSVNQVSFNQPSRPEVKCWLCKSESHHVDNCPQFLSKSVKQRYDLLKENHCCFSCLKKASRMHRASTCNKRKSCGEKLNNSSTVCKSFHHRLLHNFEAASSVVGVTSFKNGETMLPVATLKISSRSLSRHSNVMFDSGAQVTLIRDAVAKELNLPGKKMKVSIVKVGGEEVDFETKVYELKLHSFEGNRTFPLKAIGIDCISAIENRKCDMRELKTVLGIVGAVPSREDGPIDLLIGVDHGFAHTGYTVEKNNLIARHTPVGWIFYGGNGDPSVNHSVMHVSLVQERDLSDFWSTESMGVNLKQFAQGTDSGGESSDEISIREGPGGQWMASFPWVKDASLLPDNRSQAEALLYGQERRLMRTPELATAYNEQIEEMIKLGFARKLSQDEIKQYEGPVFYLPHHGVMRKDNTSTPLRIVFNSSVVYVGHCLNDYWAKGPDLFNDLFGILLRFRENHAAIVGDISKMYHRIRISEPDQHVHRFLWRNFDTTREPDTYVMNVLSFGDKPAPAMALTALRKSAESGKDDYPEASDNIKRNSYMDDICCSVNTSSQAIQLSTEIDQILNRHGFTIKKWIFNEISESKQPANESKDKEKVLGLQWDVQSDEISLKCDQMTVDSTSTLTKRTVLSRINKVFDPLGLVAAVLIRAKIGLQDLWKTKLGWDDPLPESESKRWKRLFEELDEMRVVSFPRCVTPLSVLCDDRPMLCVFSDASENAFGACAYLRWEKGDRAEARLLCAKSRVAPLRKLTIPKLELQGAVMASRLCRTIREEMRMQFSSVKLFTDSMIVWSWIQNGPRKAIPFVSCRIQEIVDSTVGARWFHIPGDMNVADQVSRGIKVSQLEGRWSQGPEFLSLPEKDWPVNKEDCEEGMQQESMGLLMHGSRE